MKLRRLIFSVLFVSYNAMASKSVVDIINANDKFSGKLYEALANDYHNILYAPFSLHVILSLLYQGAAGNTSEIIKNALHVPDAETTAETYQSLIENLNSVKNVTLDIANKVYVQHECKLKDEFRSIAKNQFLSEAENVNFAENVAAAERINEWVESKTYDRITDLIKPHDLGSLTRLVLVNAIYFMGNWKQQFKKNLTKKARFYLSETDSVDCDMMNMISRGLGYAEDKELDAQIVSLPYKNDYLSLLIILPTSKTGIKDLERKLQTRSWSSIYEKLFFGDIIHLWVPKFKIEAEINLKKPLTEMGLGGIFQYTPDFSNMLHAPGDLAVTRAVQKAVFEINELGTEAAASTVVMVSGRAVPIIFRADRPFIFALTYKQNNAVLPLFVGKLAKV